MTSGSRSTKRLRRLQRGPLAAVTLLVVLTLGPIVAQAQPADVATRTAARELATQGAEAFERGDYATALDHLSRASKLYPAPSISVMQARAMVHLGRFIEALDRYEETLRTPLPADAPEAYRTAAADAATEGEQLRHRMPHLSVQVRQGGATPNGVVVLLDGKELPAALLDVDFPADPGEHNVVVQAPRYSPVVRRVHLAEHERVVLEITLDEASPKTEVAAPPPPPPHVEQSPGSRPIWGWAAISGGAAALVVSAVTGKVALESKSNLDSVCKPSCPSNAADDIHTFRSYRTASYVAAGASIVFVGVGGYLLLTRPSDNAQVAIGPQGTNLALWGAF